MRLAAASRRKYRSALAALRAECPLLLPVRVVITSRVPAGAAGELFGWSWADEDLPRHFRITLRTRVRERSTGKERPVFPSEVVETLAHEWAHCLAWSADRSDLQDHGPAWGVAYAACYRATIED